jgi:hypothetical protein
MRARASIDFEGYVIRYQIRHVVIIIVTRQCGAIMSCQLGVTMSCRLTVTGLAHDPARRVTRPYVP